MTVRELLEKLLKVQQRRDRELGQLLQRLARRRPRFECAHCHNVLLRQEQHTNQKCAVSETGCGDGSVKPEHSANPE